MGKSISLTDEQKDYMIYNYVVLKRGVNSIGKEIGISGLTVQRHLKKMGVKIRNHQESMQECRGHNVNDNFFKVQSHDMAYVLGLIASDGYVSKDTNHFGIDIQESDEELLYKIKRVLNYEGDIMHYTSNGGCKASRIRVCSKTIKKDLEHYGIKPKKTFTLEPPFFLAPEYCISYIRGYFDGDGCIYTDFEKYKYEWFICGVKKEVLNWMKDILLNKYGIVSKVYKTSTTLSQGDPFYQLAIYKKNDIKRLFEILYPPDSIYMERKYKKMRELFMK